MPNLNRVTLIGNLTRDPSLKFSPRGTAVCEIGLAINRTYKDDHGTKHEETTFVDITFWGARAETLDKYVRKGNPLYVEGRLHLDTWEDRETGQKRSKLKIIGDQFQFLASGAAGRDRDPDTGGDGDRPDPDQP